VTRKRRLGPLIFVFSAALFVRGIYLIQSSDNPTFKVPVVDARTYDLMARTLSAKGVLTQDFYWQPPFYPFFLSGVYALTGGSIVAAKAIQLLVGALTAALAWAVGARLFGRAAGLAAGLITAFDMPLVFFEGELLSAGWAAFFALAIILSLLETAEKPTPGRFFGSGLLGILGIATRPELLPFLAAGVGWALFRAFRRSGLKAAPAALAPAVAGFLLVALPIGFLGLKATGKFRILPFSAGVNFYIGNNPDQEKTVGLRPGYEWHKLIALPERFGLRDITRKEAFFREKAVEYALSQPGRFVLGLVHKARQFFTSREIARNVDLYVFRSWSSLLRIGVWKWGRFGFPFGLLLALAAAGAVARRRSIPAPLWLFLALYPASVILVFVASRYRVPYLPVLAVLAGGGVAALAGLFREKRWKAAGSMALLAGAVLILVSVSPPFPEERRDYRAELSFFVGAALQERGELAKAAAAYEDALRRRPDYPDVWYNLGVLAEKKGNPEEAIADYRKAAEADPEYSDAFYNLGVLYQGRGRDEDAVDAYLEAVRIMPSDIFAHNNLATLLRTKGDIDGAVNHYQAALQVDPGFAAARNNLAYALSALGRWDEAVDNFRRALAVEPDSVPSLVGLSRALVSRPGRGPKDAAEAVALADRAASLTRNRDPRILKALVQACAAAGDLGRAAATARKAADLASAAGAADLAAELRGLAEKFEPRSDSRR
jgi:tetratricopeptide (TPR) repeat protein